MTATYNPRGIDWHHCAAFAGDAGGVDIVFTGRGWEMRDPEYQYGAVFQHGTTLTVVFCPFCGVRLAVAESRPTVVAPLPGDE